MPEVTPTADLSAEWARLTAALKDAPLVVDEMEELMYQTNQAIQLYLTVKRAGGSTSLSHTPNPYLSRNLLNSMEELLRTW